jgi:hypothetical protein
VLGMMDLHGAGVDMRLERIVGVRELDEFMGHDAILLR